MPVTGNISRRSALGVLGSALAACVLSAHRATSAGQTDQTPSVHRIDIRNFAFSPTELMITAGDQVEWVNLDFAPHTATSVDAAWDSGEIRKDGTATVQFTTIGSHEYFCAYHPHMKARVTVQARKE